MNNVTNVVPVLSLEQAKAPVCTGDNEVSVNKTTGEIPPRPERRRTTGQRQTMADVARRAGVSTATVSRALTRPDQVNAKTRDMVRKIAQELGFRPNLIGRQLRTQAAHSLLILVQDLENPFYSELIKGAESVCRERQFSVMVGGTDGYEDVETLYAEQFLGGRVDGLILLTGHLPAGLSASLATQSPVVLVSEDNPELDLCAVLIDNPGWATRATAHLIAQGHRRIAHLCGPMTRIISPERREGYRRALATAGIAHDPRLEVPGDFSFESGREAVRQLLSLPEPPTAIFCANDESALGAIRAVQQAGLSVPGDISIIGFDDTKLAQFSDPPLTTVRQPRQQMGAAAADLVIGLIENGPAQRTRLLLDCQLIERGTVGPCPVPR
ncbi:LacI family transcriptional regulator [Thioclava sp. BHET1]|nr:LacI family transcriptional regulator [Thioclava sp. BHET1]